MMSLYGCGEGRGLLRCAASAKVAYFVGENVIKKPEQNKHLKMEVCGLKVPGYR